MIRRRPFTAGCEPPVPSLAPVEPWRGRRGECVGVTGEGVILCCAEVGRQTHRPTWLLRLFLFFLLLRRVILAGSTCCRPDSCALPLELPGEDTEEDVVRVLGEPEEGEVADGTLALAARVGVSVKASAEDPEATAGSAVAGVGDATDAEED